MCRASFLLHLLLLLFPLALYGSYVDYTMCNSVIYVAHGVMGLFRFILWCVTLLQISDSCFAVSLTFRQLHL